MGLLQFVYYTCKSVTFTIDDALIYVQTLRHIVLLIRSK
jgi:hypothetical protein